MAKALHLSYARIHGSVPLLLKRRLIKCEETGKSRAGLPIMTYSLTLKGLVITLYEQPELWKEIDDIVLKHKLMGPLVFKKWDQFVKAGARKVVLSRLRIPIGYEAQAYYARPTYYREFDANDIEYIDNHVLRMDNAFILGVFSEEEIASFISVLSTDPELESFVIKHNNKNIKSTAWLLENQKAYGRAIRENRPELFLSKLEHRDPLQKWGIDKSKMPKVRVFERKVEPEDEM